MNIFLLALVLIFIGMIVFGVYFFLQMIKKQKEAEKEKEKHIPTTQENLPIESIRSGIMKLKTGGYRLIIELPSINIDLMEASEREGVLLQYRQVLNSLRFKFQYLQQSRVIDIQEYLNTIEVLRANATTKFAKNQLGFYNEFLENLIKERSVLTKKFFIIIPYDPHIEDKESRRAQYHAFDRNKEAFEKAQNDLKNNDVFQEEKRFEKARKELESRANLVISAFRRFEVNGHVLNDEEILDLMYTTYNKDRSMYQRVGGNLSDYTTIRVDSDLGQKVTLDDMF